jgi:hypothetical protein
MNVILVSNNSREHPHRITSGLPATREPRIVWAGVITLEQKHPLAIANIKKC